MSNAVSIAKDATVGGVARVARAVPRMGKKADILPISKVVPIVKSAEDEYEDTLRALSEASVNRHFEPYVDIDWESPDFAVTEDDDRWILNASSDPLGAHPWYQAQP